MINIFIKCNNPAEEQRIRRLCSDFTALCGEERLMVSSFKDFSDEDSLSGPVPCFDLIIYFVCGQGDIPCLISLRQASPDARILLMAARDLSPESYVNSGIMPAELLLIPYGQERLSKTIRKLINSICEERFEELHTLRFAVRQGDEIVYVPTREIYYFEARDKKILLKSARKEILFWGYLKEIKKKLPPCFARCHRSIIINTLRIERINWSLATIFMEDQTRIPFSRKFKKDLELSMRDIAA